MSNSFFEKLKKGMENEESVEEKTENPVKEPVEEKETKKTEKKLKKAKKETVANPKEKSVPTAKQTKKLEIKTAAVEQKTEDPAKISEESKEENKEQWLASEETEGQLAIDVYQTEDEAVIQSAVAGVRPENLDISFEKDIITIRGRRDRPFEEKGDYFFQECYWGAFSREIILSSEVDPGRATAELKEGILTIRIPKILREKIKKIIVKG